MEMGFWDFQYRCASRRITTHLSLPLEPSQSKEAGSHLQCARKTQSSCCEDIRDRGGSLGDFAACGWDGVVFVTVQYLFIPGGEMEVAHDHLHDNLRRSSHYCIRAVREIHSTDYIHPVRAVDGPHSVLCRNDVRVRFLQLDRLGKLFLLHAPGRLGFEYHEGELHQRYLPRGFMRICNFRGRGD